MSSQRRWHPTTYLLTIKQGDEESLKAYLSWFNKECMTIDDLDEKISLATLLGGVWPQSQFMVELTRRTPVTLREFIDQADNFINAKDTLQALTEPRKKELQRAERKARAPANAKAYEKQEKSSQDKRREEAPTRGLGPRFNRPVLTIHEATPLSPVKTMTKVLPAVTAYTCNL
ncbi:uncharacterized protein LOC121238137 [Juglans microcarpa x Juglans regia]|uniref:uncharacterized protein LOC121238137 n=1 Tax=Juglans microcarpa x Juglans regia TaxID=2249226 RepID=UPI001B7DA8DF|nr:uncharacterized protein LOC121238137 [Juglans microcarpa x Juglans regia]